MVVSVFRGKFVTVVCPLYRVWIDFLFRSGSVNVASYGGRFSSKNMHVLRYILSLFKGWKPRGGCPLITNILDLVKGKKKCFHVMCTDLFQKYLKHAFFAVCCCLSRREKSKDLKVGGGEMRSYMLSRSRTFFFPPS